MEREEVDQQDRRHERGHRDGGKGDRADDPVAPPVRPIGREHARRDRHGKRDRLRQDHQLERHREALHDRVPDVLLVDEGPAPVAGEDAADPFGIADEHGTVEPHLLADRLDLGFGTVHAGHLVGDVARQDVHEQEGDECDHDHHDEQSLEPSEQVVHRFSPWRCLCLCRAGGPQPSIPCSASGPVLLRMRGLSRSRLETRRLCCIEEDTIRHIRVRAFSPRSRPPPETAPPHPFPGHDAAGSGPSGGVRGPRRKACQITRRSRRG